MGKDKYSNQRKNRSSSKKHGRDDFAYDDDRRLDYPGKRKGKRINPHEWDRFEDDGWRA